MEQYSLCVADRISWFLVSTDVHFVGDGLAQLARFRIYLLLQCIELMTFVSYLVLIYLSPESTTSSSA